MLTEEEMTNLEQKLLRACRKAEKAGFKIGNGYCCPFQALMGMRVSPVPPGSMTAAKFLGDESLEREISAFMDGFDGSHNWAVSRESPMYRMGQRFRDLSLREAAGRSCGANGGGGR